jgi:hypothetical protein
MYFDKFPYTEYNGQRVRNITRVCRLTDAIKKYETLFLPYTLQYNERVENLSYDYYGTVNNYWLVMFSNNIMDPYNDWYKDDNVMNASIIQKYGSLSAAATNIEHYKIAGEGPYEDIIVSKDTLDLEPQSVVAPEPVTSYDIEMDKNLAKRDVVLLSNELAGEATTLLERLLSE